MDPMFQLDGKTAIASSNAAGPWDPSMLHGGAPTGLIVRLIEDVPTPSPMQLARLTVDLKRPVPVGELNIDVTTTREGRNIQTVAVTLSANGKEVVTASALRIRTKQFDLPEDAQLPRQSSSPSATASNFVNAEGFNSGVEVMEANASSSDAANAVWFRIKRPFFADRDTTPLMRAAATGDYCNGFGCPLDFEQWTFLNADLTLHFAREPVGEWIMLAANSWIGPDGRGLAFGQLADKDGYFGRAAQSLVVARR